jgi:hypothetical protein
MLSISVTLLIRSRAASSDRSSIDTPYRLLRIARLDGKLCAEVPGSPTFAVDGHPHDYPRSAGLAFSNVRRCWQKASVASKPQSIRQQSKLLGMKAPFLESGALQQPHSDIDAKFPHFWTAQSRRIRLKVDGYPFAEATTKSPATQLHSVPS